MKCFLFLGICRVVRLVVVFVGCRVVFLGVALFKGFVVVFGNRD